MTAVLRELAWTLRVLLVGILRMVAAEPWALRFVALLAFVQAYRHADDGMLIAVMDAWIGILFVILAQNAARRRKQ